MRKVRSRAIRLAVLQRDDNKCRLCYGTEYLTNHHIVPLSWKGGEDSVENGVTLCRGCHDFIERMYCMKLLRPNNCVQFIEIHSKLKRKFH